MKSSSRPLGPQPSALSPSARAPGARSVALHVLIQVEREGVFADEALDRALTRTRLDARDRALVFELVYGVLRHRATLDWRLNHVADRPVERLPAFVRNALRLGAYQALHLQKIPASAAVNESVTLVKAAAAKSGRDWSGFVNAVLRALLSESEPNLPDPATDPVAALAIRFSCPRWLIERWVRRLGPEQAEVLCRTTLEVPPLTLRANTLRTTREELARELTSTGYQVRPTAISPVGLILEKCGAVTALPQFATGAFYAEDEAAQLIPPLLDPQPGERVLDACAAPGGKTTQLAALMRNRGEIVAVDRSPARVRLVEENCRRLGVAIVTPVAADLARDVPSILRERPFDRILVDAPCSGLGVLRRHPEGKWQKGAETLERHQATQLALLKQVRRLLRPGGAFVYSTCSTEPEENEQVIAQFCHEHPEFRRESVAPWLPPPGHVLLTAQGDLSTMFAPHPTAPMDAFFAARLRKADR